MRMFDCVLYLVLLTYGYQLSFCSNKRVILCLSDNVILEEVN